MFSPHNLFHRPRSDELVIIQPSCCSSYQGTKDRTSLQHNNNYPSLKLEESGRVVSWLACFSGITLMFFIPVGPLLCFHLAQAASIFGFIGYGFPALKIVFFYELI